MRYHEFRAMSTDILLAAEGTADEVEPGFQQIRAYIEECERRFTRFSESSELSALNRSAGSWFEASAEMFEMITLALRFHEKTRGLFDPSVLNALERAGYDRTIDEVKAREAAGERRGAGAPGDAKVAAVEASTPLDPAGRRVERQSAFASRAVAQEAATLTLPAREHFNRFADLRLDYALRRICLPAGMRIDLGGIAKGWIAEQAARRLSVWSRACAVDAGGDAFFRGLPAGETAWRVTLEDPSNTAQGLAILKIGPGAVATSAITKRRWQQDGKTQHHLIVPRTQQPAETDWLSVTVVAPHTTEAEIFAKCLLIGGLEEAERITRTSPGVEFIAVDKNLKLWGSRNSREILDV